MVKHSKVSSSTKWRLRGNVILDLMECLNPSVTFDVFMDSYCVFLWIIMDNSPTLELTKFEQHVCSTKKVMQMHYHWGEIAATKERDHFEQRTFYKKAVHF